jgi:tetratricopeptide (TPR) repeat protein
VGYIIASLVAILLATLIVYKLANSIFGLDLRLKPLLLCALCAMFISLVLPKIVVGFAGLSGTLAVLAVFAVVFAYFVAKYEDNSSFQEDDAEPEADMFDPGPVSGIAGSLTIEAVNDGKLDEQNQAVDSQAGEQPAYVQASLHTAENIEILADGSEPDNDAEVSAFPETALEATTTPEEVSSENADEEYVGTVSAEGDTQVILQTQMPGPAEVLEIIEAQPEAAPEGMTAVLEADAEEVTPVEESSDVAGEVSAGEEYLQAAAPEQMAEPALTDLSEPVQEVAGAEEVTPVEESSDVTGEVSAGEEHLQAAAPEQMAEPALKELSEPVQEVAGVEAADAAEENQETVEQEIEPEITEPVVTSAEASHAEVAAVTEAVIHQIVVEPAASEVSAEAAQAGLQDHVPELPEIVKMEEIAPQPVQIEIVADSSGIIEDLSSKVTEPVIADSRKEVVQERLEGIPEQSFGREAESSTMNYNEPLPESEDLDDLLDFAFVSKESQDFSAAFRAFNRALVLYPNSDAAPFLVVEIGNILKNKGSYDEAIRVLSDGRSLSHIRHDKMMEQEFISAIAYLRITKNVLLQNRLGNIPFTDIPPQIVQQIDEEFKEWRNVGNI